MAKTTRKCKVCGNDFNIFKNDYVKFKGGFTEIKCYKKCRRDKGFTDEYINSEIAELLKETREEKRARQEQELTKLQKKNKAKKRELNRKENHEKLIEYFSDTYCIQNIPKYFFSKLAQINNGTFKGVPKGIPYEDLYDMFRLKQKDLNNIAESNKRKGNIIEGISRLNYDLAVIINKYDGYLKWKQKQKQLALDVQKIKEEEKETKVDFTYINKVVKTKQREEIDISSLIDDIY